MERKVLQRQSPAETVQGVAKEPAEDTRRDREFERELDQARQGEELS